MAEPGIIEMTAAFRKQTRQLKRGPHDRYTVEFSADNMVMDFSDKAIREHMNLVASAIAESIAQEIGQISAEAAPSTIARRERARRDRRSQWYRQNYAGGRIGDLPPHPTSTQLFNDSGRLKRLHVMFRKTSRNTQVATVNFPANRFSPTLVSNPEGMFSRLQSLVPTLRGEFTGASYERVGTALDVAVGIMALSGEASTELLRLQAQIRANTAALASLKSGIVKVFK